MTHTENSKYSIKNSELINEFSKFEDYKDNTQNPVTILYTNRKLSESKIKKILIAVTTKRISVSKFNQGLLKPIERVTGRKARVLQMEEIACKCQTFLSLLSGRRKQTSNIFSFSTQI